MRVFLVKLRGLAGELRDGGHRVVARECREVDGRVAEFINFRVVVALPGGLADAGYLFLHAFRAPCRGVFLQVIGVFHGIAVFDKIRKIIRSPPLSGRIYFLFRRPLRAFLLSGTASGFLFRRGRAVSGALRNGIRGRPRSRCASRIGHGVRAIRPGLFRNGPAKSCPGPLDPYPCRRACASAQPPASAHCPCPLLLFPSVSAFGVPRGRPSRCFAFLPPSLSCGALSFPSYALPCKKRARTIRVRGQKDNESAERSKYQVYRRLIFCSAYARSNGNSKLGQV